MFPIKVLRDTERIPYVTYAIIVINVLVFLWELSLGMQLGQTFNDLAVVPCTIGGDPIVDTILDFARSMFLHGSWVHLIGNMAFLLVFGPHIESFMGRKWFLLFYLLAGYAASFAHALLNSWSCAPTVGASGAISGILGSYLLLYPTTRIRSVVLLYRIPVGTAELHAFYMLLYIFLLDLIDGIGQLAADSFTIGGVAVWAHVGGFVTGAAFTFLFTAFVKPLPKWDSLD
ncbi:MAG: rhomboid family intramembrane serine protease [Anaerolineae bacterium]|nr:rhomboid family intramembrane serine protease [Anaerolineae bacterium]